MAFRINTRTVIAVLSAIVVGSVGAKWWKRISYESTISKRVDATRHALPHVVQDGITQTGVKLDGHLLKSRFETNIPFDTTPELTAAMTKSIKESVCDSDDYRDMLVHGYTFEHTFERTFAMGAPSGTGPLTVAITAADCPGVVVRK